MKKIIPILITTLLMSTALTAIGQMNLNNNRLEEVSKPLNLPREEFFRLWENKRNWLSNQTNKKWTKKMLKKLLMDANFNYFPFQTLVKNLKIFFLYHGVILDFKFSLTYLISSIE